MLRQLISKDNGVFWSQVRKLRYSGTKKFLDPDCLDKMLSDCRKNDNLAFKKIKSEKNNVTGNNIPRTSCGVVAYTKK